MNNPMPGIKAVLSPAFSIDNVYQSFKGRVVARPQTHKHILESMYRYQVADPNRKDQDQEDPKAIFPEVSDQPVDQKEIEGDPHELVADVEHHHIPEA